MNQVIFEVARDANKIQIRAAVERLFNVKVVDVHTMIVRGKMKRMGRGYAKTQNWKKAIVTLREGDKIDVLRESRRERSEPWRSSPSSRRRPARALLRRSPTSRSITEEEAGEVADGAPDLHGRPQQRTAASPRASAAAATSSATASSTGSATRSASPRRSRRSSTIPTAPRASRSSTTWTARRRTSSRPTASRSATPWCRAATRTSSRATRCRCGSSRSAR